MEKKWNDLGDNQVLSSDGFYISYNPDTGASKSGLGELFNLLGHNISDGKLEVDGRAETALVLKTGNGKNIFYILNGDFRKEYEELFPKGFAACKKFYDRNKKKHRSNWSTV